MSEPVRHPLTADGPADWLDRHLTTYFHYSEELKKPAGERELREVALGDLLDSGAGIVRERYEGELVEGWTPQAAATGVVGGYAGALAGLVTFAAFAGGAHLLPTAAGVRWLLEADGWPAAATLAGRPAFAVAPDHPWAGLEGAVVDADPKARAARCLDAIVEVLTPIVEAARACTKVGRAGLWNAVADQIGHSIMYQVAFPADAGHVEIVQDLLDAPARPWRAGPDIRAVDTAVGPICVAQRGGCCLVYTVDWPDDDDDHEHDDLHARFYESFPDPPGAPGYCNDCSLRDPEDCFARLVWWRTEELKAMQGGGTT